MSQMATAIAMPAAVPIKMPFIGFPMAKPSGRPARMQSVRKQPPDRVVLRMGAQCTARASMVNAALTMFVGSRSTGVR